MKKILQTVFCHKTIDVIDANSGKNQKATYFMVFGITLNITYK